MKTLIKLAEDFEKTLQYKDDSKKANSSTKKNLAMYVAMLRGLYMIHQHAHLTARSEKSYGDHLLFERLYKGTEAHIDQAFEKIIGNFGEECCDLKEHAEKTKEFIDEMCASEKDLAERSLKSETVFLNFAKDLRSLLEKQDVLSFGMDDLIMTISSDHEDFVYLLKQRVIIS